MCGAQSAEHFVAVVVVVAMWCSYHWSRGAVSVNEGVNVEPIFNVAAFERVIRIYRHAQRTHTRTHAEHSRTQTNAQPQPHTSNQSVGHVRVRATERASVRACVRALGENKNVET